MEECESLLVLLGVDPSLLQDRIARRSAAQLSTLNPRHMDPLVAEGGRRGDDDSSSDEDYESVDPDNIDSDGNDGTNDAAELQELMDQIEAERSHYQDSMTIN